MISRTCFIDDNDMEAEKGHHSAVPDKAKMSRQEALYIFETISSVGYFGNTPSLDRTKLCQILGHLIQEFMVDAGRDQP